MCGIFGSNDRERFLTLYELNRKRGTFSASISVIFSNHDVVSMKWEGSPTTKALEQQFKLTKELTRGNASIVAYLGHTQAPTSAKRKYDRDTSHPFSGERYTIAHNGVLTNFEKLKRHYAPKWKNPVDSSIIPYIFDKIEQDAEDINPMVSISKGLSLLEGTFGLWIYDCGLKDIYLARCGSTLFANMLTNDFSSIKFENSDMLDEGVIYQLTREGVTSVGLFDFNSPFFT